MKINAFIIAAQADRRKGATGPGFVFYNQKRLIKEKAVYQTAEKDGVFSKTPSF